MSESFWRDRARPIIARVLAEHGGKDSPELRKALRDAYPFWERKYWPYKIWLDEIKRQLGLKQQLWDHKPQPKDAPAPGPALFDDEEVQP